MKVLLVFFLSVANIAYAKQIRVAVIDTGINAYLASNVKRCNNLDRDFTGQGFLDVRNHGTFVTNLIAEGNENVDYCVIIIKYFHLTDKDAINNTIEALTYAFSLNVDIINYSSGGEYQSPDEKRMIKRILDHGIRMIVVAGNNGTDLYKNCDYFPACYDKRLIVVGALDYYGKRLSSSNYESKKRTIDLMLNGIYDKDGVYLQGTSFAVPRATSILIRVKNVKKNKVNSMVINSQKTCL